MKREFPQELKKPCSGRRLSTEMKTGIEGLKSNLKV
jgi:hypothetical protein